jgi:uncharacterized membrane protein
MRPREADLAITALVAVMTCAAAAVGAPVAVMTVLGVLLFAAPGYLLGQLLIGSDGSGLERVAAAAGLVFCVPIIGGLLLYAAELPLRRATWLALLAGVTLVSDVVLFLARRRQSAGTRRPPGSYSACLLSAGYCCTLPNCPCGGLHGLPCWPV